MTACSGGAGFFYSIDRLLISISIIIMRRLNFENKPNCADAEFRPYAVDCEFY